MVDQGWIFSICPVMAYQVIAQMQGTSLSRRWTLGIEATVGRSWACSRLVTVATIICAVGVLGMVNEMYMEEYIMARRSGFLSHSHISPSSTQRLALLLICITRYQEN